ncbi:hypothetical protein MNBD_GAMMA08-1347 [hydrothermal vent metagenome]|uniref:CBS domain-containing protein n=1 Tax=hydrothermal vent metagenome TaxID=652676 RepID=A0A3B0XSE4_9ZZZZ
MIVKEIMSTAIKTATVETKIHDIASTMCLNKISGVPVIDKDNKLCGILSEKDILRAMFPGVEQIMQQGAKADFESIEADYKGVMSKKVGDLMTLTVASVTPDMPLLKAASLILEKSVESRKYAQLLDSYSYMKKVFITNKVTSHFFITLSKSITCTSFSRPTD